MSHGRLVSVVGLGYVGLPVAVSLAGKGTVIAFDISERRVSELRAGRDHTGEVDAADLARPGLVLTADPEDLRKADFHIIAVPTPVDDANRPDLTPLIAASRTVGRRLKRGDIVVYESTVYPGATEMECVPVLETESGLKFGTDFTVGYSPERINPGDREHRFETILKIVSGSDADTLDIVASVYGSVVRAGVHRASSIAVAEAAKVIENTQRDINIALMNELAVIFHRLGIDTHDVLTAAGTKWNFLRFQPGLVGGHCIGVDPYYLTYRAEQIGVHPRVILSGRHVNDDMGGFIAREVVKNLTRAGVSKPKVAVLGVTFKENVPDIRNSRVIDIIRELESFGIEVRVHDPMASVEETRAEYGIDLLPVEALGPADAVVLAVSHKTFVDAGWALPSGLLREGRGLVADVKCALDRAAAPDGVRLWRL